MARTVGNGCGPNGWRKLPQWHSFQTCVRHDIAYFEGGTEADRKIADVALLHGMRDDANTRPVWQRPFYYTMAQVYYTAVRYKGAQYFHYGTKRPFGGVAFAP